MQPVRDPVPLWPVLDYAGWRDTATTLHLWTQIVGKICVKLSPWLNHGWHVSLHVNARGLGTSPMHAGGRVVQIDFDFVRHRLVVRTSDGPERAFPLEPMSVAAFYRRFIAALEAAGLDVPIDCLPNEVSDPIRFPDDELHAAYDAAAVHTFWRALIQVDRVFRLFRTVFSVNPAPCTCSGAASTWPSPASRVGWRRCIRAVSPACRTR